VGFEELFERERQRYEDGMARLDAEQVVRTGNAAWGAGLSLLMLGRDEEAALWLDRAAGLWRSSWEHATETSWGRPIGAVKAELIAGRDREAADHARWALALRTAEAESPIGRYAAVLALLTLGRFDEAEEVAATLVGRDDFPADVAAALAAIAAGDGAAYGVAVESVLVSFETREGYLEDVPVADTAIVLDRLARRRGLDVGLRASALLP
jgi:hypothetical protein